MKQLDELFAVQSRINSLLKQCDDILQSSCNPSEVCKLDPSVPVTLTCNADNKYNIISHEEVIEGYMPNTEDSAPAFFSGFRTRIQHIICIYAQLCNIAGDNKSLSSLCNALIASLAFVNDPHTDLTINVSEVTAIKREQRKQITSLFSVDDYRDASEKTGFTTVTEGIELLRSTASEEFKLFQEAVNDGQDVGLLYRIHSIVINEIVCSLKYVDGSNEA